VNRERVHATGEFAGQRCMTMRWRSIRLFPLKAPRHNKTLKWVSRRPVADMTFVLVEIHRARARLRA